MRMTVTAETALHLRATASRSGQVVTYLRNGDMVEAFGRPDRFQWQWVRSLRTGQYGYVDADFLASVPEAPAPKRDPRPQPLSVPKRENPGASFWVGLAVVIGFIAFMLFVR